MAARKVTTKPAAKTTDTAVKTITSKAEEKKVETPVVIAKAEKEVKAETVAKEEPAKKEAAKEEPAKKEAAKEEPAKKEAAKKPATKKTAAKKAELKSTMHVQFAQQSYSQEDLLKIAKDVWKYDLKQKARDLTSVELYVKPEERLAYYVMNKEFTGSFYI